MGKIIVSEFLSLDGVVEGAGPDDPFKFAGWTMGYHGKGSDTFKFKELFDADALLMGRVTYDGFSVAWPEMADDAGFADRMNSLPKYVVSTTLKKPTWKNARIISENVVEEIQKLKRVTKNNILVYGSANLVETLFEHGLVDEVCLMIHPVALGVGEKLFKANHHIKLNFIEALTFQPDLVVLRYAVTKDSKS